jgi:hypothetical protein
MLIYKKKPTDLLGLVKELRYFNENMLQLLLALGVCFYCDVRHAANVAEGKQRTRQEQCKQITVLTLIVVEDTGQFFGCEERHERLTEHIRNILYFIKHLINN